MGKRRTRRRPRRNPEVVTPSKADAAVALSVPDPSARDAALRELKEFRVDVRSCLTRWGDALFEIADAVLCSEGPVRNLAELSLVPELPILPGTVIRLDVDRLPSGGSPKPLWLWWSRTGADADLADSAWSCFLRRFDLEHTFRYWKQHLGWTSICLRSPAAADRWTALVLAVYTQLRLARPLAADLKRPWEKPLAAHQITPGRVRRGFRQVRRSLPVLTNAPKPSRPGPGRPPGRRNTRKAPTYEAGNALLGTADQTDKRTTEQGPR
jgi:hypothetical protein